MRRGTRTVLAGTASVALAGAGALSAVYAAHSQSPASTSVPVVSNDDARVAALAREASDLRAQVADLEAAAGRAPLATETPTPTEPAESPDEPVHSPSASPAATFDPAPTAAVSDQPHESAAPEPESTEPEPEPSEPEHESGEHGYGALDD